MSAATFTIESMQQDHNGLMLTIAQSDDDLLVFDTAPIKVRLNDGDLYDNLAVGDKVKLSLGKA